VIAYALTAALVAVVALQAWLHGRALEHRDRLHAKHISDLQVFQDADRDKWAAERRGMLAQSGTERLAWERERGTLLNRIKPETRQYVPLTPGDTPQMPLAVPYDDDEAFQAEVESREALAERLGRQELQERVTSGRN
jgi:hypothetical protein